MRWSRPEDRSRRIVTRYLWLSLQIGGETRWLETATWVEEYAVGYGWIPVRWVDDDE